MGKNFWLNLEKTMLAILVIDLVFMGILFFKHLTKNQAVVSTIQIQEIIPESQLQGVDPQIKKFVVDFLRSAKEKNIKLSSEDLKVVFGNTRLINSKYVGYCFIEQKKVMVDRKYWNESSEDIRQQLIDHELGHCLLQRAHIQDKERPLRPSSLMHPHLFDGTFYSKNKELYRNELFNPLTFGSLNKKQVAQKK